MKHIEVVAGVIEHDGKILCMERDKGKYDYVSFKWEFPGGKIEEGETKEEALKRELREEMEMSVEITGHLIDVYHEYPDFTMNMYTFNCIAKSKEFKMNVHHDFKWLDKSELNSLDWAPADLPIVKKILEGQFSKQKHSREMTVFLLLIVNNFFDFFCEIIEVGF